MAASLYDYGKDSKRQNERRQRSPAEPSIVTVPLLEGKARLRVPAETQVGNELRLKGQGMPVQGDAGTRGDLYVTIEVRLPAKLTEKERALFQELAGLRPEEK